MFFLFVQILVSWKLSDCYLDNLNKVWKIIYYLDKIKWQIIPSPNSNSNRSAWRHHSQSTSIAKTLLHVCFIVVLCNLRHSAYACHFLTCCIFRYITVWYVLVGVTHSGVMYDNGPLEHVSGTVAHEECHFWGRTTAAKSYQMVTNGQ